MRAPPLLSGGDPVPTPSWRSLWGVAAAGMESRTA